MGSFHWFQEKERVREDREEKEKKVLAKGGGMNFPDWSNRIRLNSDKVLGGSGGGNSEEKKSKDRILISRSQQQRKMRKKSH